MVNHHLSFCGSFYFVTTVRLFHIYRENPKAVIELHVKKTKPLRIYCIYPVKIFCWSSYSAFSFEVMLNYIELEVKCVTFCHERIRMLR